MELQFVLELVVQVDVRAAVVDDTEHKQEILFEFFGTQRVVPVFEGERVEEAAEEDLVVVEPLIVRVQPRKSLVDGFRDVVSLRLLIVARVHSVCV